AKGTRVGPAGACRGGSSVVPARGPVPSFYQGKARAAPGPRPQRARAPAPGQAVASAGHRAASGLFPLAGGRGDAHNEGVRPVTTSDPLTGGPQPMWAALALTTVLNVAPAQLELKNDRMTYGVLGQERKGDTLYPGEMLVVAFDIEG